HRLARLLRHLHVDAGFRLGLEATGVDHDEGALADAPPAVLAIPRQARDVGDQRRAAPGEPVEECRLADVRASDQRDDRQQGHQSSATAATRPRTVWTIASSPARRGAETMALPSIRTRPT